MSVPLHSFNEAFNNASRRSKKGLTKGHEEQLNKLKDIADAISAEGAFRAELTQWQGDTLGLKMTSLADGQTVTFRIGFGFEPFGGTPTIILTTSAAQTPIGNKEGYALQFDTEKFLKELGTAVAEHLADIRLTSEALKYATNSKAAPNI